MVEIHDASPATGGPYGLFGFIGVPPGGRGDVEALRHHCLAQLVRMFGAQAAQPDHLFLKDWAVDRFTALQADSEPLYAHPVYGMPTRLQVCGPENCNLQDPKSLRNLADTLKGL